MKTRTDKGVSHQRGSANVYADLGYKSADEMLVKAQLVTTIAEILAERGYTQTTAAALLGIPQPKLSKMLRGQFRGFSERKLMDCLTLLGRDIDIVVRATSKRKRAGRGIGFICIARYTPTSSTVVNTASRVTWIVTLLRGHRWLVVVRHVSRDPWFDDMQISQSEASESSGHVGKGHIWPWVFRPPDHCVRQLSPAQDSGSLRPDLDISSA
jgi:predicted XRE-type DNA-binding protein